MGGNSNTVCLVEAYFTNGPANAKKAFEDLYARFDKHGPKKISVGTDSEGYDIRALIEEHGDDSFIYVYRHNWSKYDPKERPTFRFGRSKQESGPDRYTAWSNDYFGRWQPLNIKPRMSNRNDFELGFQVYTQIFDLEKKYGEKYACSIITYESHPVITTYESHPVITTHESKPLEATSSSQPVEVQHSSLPSEQKASGGEKK